VLLGSQARRWIGDVSVVDCQFGQARVERNIVARSVVNPFTLSLAVE
jgi:hypothetical protein